MPSKSKIEVDESKLIKIKATHVITLYPRPPIVLGTPGNEFGITKWEIREVQKGSPKVDNKNQIAIKGVFPEPLQYKYQDYTIVAQEMEDDRYGCTYKLLYVNPIKELQSVKNQKVFLSSFLTQGQIDEFYKIYDNPLEVIKSENIEALKKVKGVGSHIAHCIINRFKEKEDISEAIIELAPYGVTETMLKKLLLRYKTNAEVIRVVKEDPYQLCYDVHGIGFLKADAIAQAEGLNPKGINRVKAYILYYLTEQVDSVGDSYVKAIELKNAIYSFFDGYENILDYIEDEQGNTTNNLALALTELQNEGIIVVEPNEKPELRRVYLTRLYNLEDQIAHELMRLLSANNKFKYDDWLDAVQVMEKNQGFNFDEKQIKGIKLGLDQQVCLISGLAGAGKSSLVAGILASLHNYNFAQCALSGKAAARLQEVTGAEGSTIHRLLGYQPKGGGFDYNENNPLPYDIIILDEISLVGGEIFLSLIKAIPTGSKLIMLGDLGQLESIGALNLAYDFYNSPYIPSVELKTVHRQAAESGIITTAHDVRNNMSICARDFDGIEVVGAKKDMVLDITYFKDEICDKVMDWFVEEYNGPIVNKDINKIQLISPVKTRGKSCVYELNTKVQKLINPIKEGEPYFVSGPLDKQYTIHEGDKIMCIKNNYHVGNSSGEMAAMFNGWTGIVERIDLMYQNMVYIYFPIVDDTYSFSLQVAKESIILGYASTVHKLQGSDAPVVIGALDTYTPNSMLTCQLLYTLITRAKKKCILVGENTAVSIATASDYVSDKRTFMQEILEELNN